MFTTREILYTSAIPGAVALLVLVLAWRPWCRGDAAVMQGHWGGAAGAGTAFLLSYALLDGEIPAWPPGQSRHWLFYLCAGLTALGLLDALLWRFVRIADWLRAEVALLVAAAVVVCLFWSLLHADTWPPAVAALWVLGMVAVLQFAWVSAERLVDRLPRGAGAAVLFTFTTGVAVVTMLSGSLVYGRLAAVLSVVAAAALLVSFLSRGFSLARGGVTVIVPVAVAILFLGYHLADPGVGAMNGSLLLAALLLPWLARLPPLKRRRPWVRTATGVLLAVLPVGVAAWRAGEAFRRAQQENRGAGELYTLHARRPGP